MTLGNTLYCTHLNVANWCFQLRWGPPTLGSLKQAWGLSNAWQRNPNELSAGRYSGVIWGRTVYRASMWNMKEWDSSNQNSSYTYQFLKQHWGMCRAVTETYCGRDHWVNYGKFGMVHLKVAVLLQSLNLHCTLTVLWFAMLKEQLKVLCWFLLFPYWKWFQ